MGVVGWNVTFWLVSDNMLAANEWWLQALYVWFSPSPACPSSCCQTSEVPRHLWFAIASKLAFQSYKEETNPGVGCGLQQRFGSSLPFLSACSDSTTNKSSRLEQQEMQALQQSLVCHWCVVWTKPLIWFRHSANPRIEQSWIYNPWLIVD